MQWFNSLVTDTAVASTDPNFANVVLLMHGDGTNGGSTFTDVKGHTTSVGTGSPTTSTTQFKFGTASLLFPGSSRINVTIAANEYNFTGDYTVECWVYFTGSGGAQVLVGTSDTFSTTGWAFATAGANLQNFTLGGSAGAASFTLGVALSTNTWYHLAVCRSGTSTRMFVNGTQGGTTQTDSTSYTSSATTCGVGQAPNGTFGATAYIDDVRVTKGVARYTSNFTAPTAAFPNS